jgi:hypothetical protein
MSFYFFFMLLVISCGRGRESLSEADVFGQEYMEETPKFRPICIGDAPFLIVEGNIHQAMWILTNEQIKVLQTKCNFLNQTSDSRYSLTALFINYYSKLIVVRVRYFQRIHEFNIPFWRRRYLPLRCSKAYSRREIHVSMVGLYL